MKLDQLLEDWTDGAHEENATNLPRATLIKQNLTHEQVLHFCHNKAIAATNAFLRGSRILRAFHNTERLASTPFIADSTRAKRKSAHTFNYYTLLMDDSVGWERYPSRSKSFICAAHENFRTSIVLAVLPVDGTDIAGAGTRDIWHAFDYLRRETAIGRLNEFNEELKDLFAFAGLVGRQDADLETFKKAVKTVEEKLKKIKDYDEFNDQYSGLRTFNKALWKNRDDVWGWLKDLLNPYDNHIVLRDVNEIGNFEQGEEIWFAGEALFMEELQLEAVLKGRKLEFD